MKTLQRFCKPVAAVLLALVLALGALLPCFAAEAAPVLPHVDIRGFMNAAIYADQNDPTSDQLWPLDVKRILQAAGDCIPSLARFALNKDYDKLTESIVPYINELFRPLMCDEHGDPVVEGSGAYLYYPTYDEVLAEPKLSFSYDWRLDPYVSAARLNDYVTYLTDTLGFGQVVMECHSNGGVVMLTYLSVYGAQRVKSVCFSASAIYGAGFAGELVKGNLLIDEGGLNEYLLSAFDNNERAALLTGLMEALDKAGIISSLTSFANGLIEHSHDYLYKKSVLPIFGNWLNIWAMVPDDDVEAGKDYIFGELMADEDVDYTAFLERVDAFTADFRVQREAHLRAVNDACSVYVFCFYGYTGIPITRDWTVMSDGVLMSKDSSFGAEFYSVGSLDEFEPGPGISPDGKVNGATALFPDQTWYFKHCRHSLAHPDLDAMAETLLYADGQATVETFEAYPQFMRFDRLTRTIGPDDGVVTSPLTFLQRVQAFFRDLWARLIAVFQPR
ncbi:MAG: hypothetical protein IJK64_03940 [Clostridia bacterium]|nr:hypothetical protein [Clostridia bacterium]